MYVLLNIHMNSEFLWTDYSHYAWFWWTPNVCKREWARCRQYWANGNTRQLSLDLFNTVQSTGGHISYRVLVVHGPYTILKRIWSDECAPHRSCERPHDGGGTLLFPIPVLFADGLWCSMGQNVFFIGVQGVILPLSLNAIWGKESDVNNSIPE